MVEGTLIPLPQPEIWMFLKSLTFEDKRLGWKLENLELDRFNLLVGISGAGKTRILRAIRRIQSIARGLRNSLFESPIDGISFELRFELDEQPYSWTLDASAPGAAGRPLLRGEDVASVIQEERIVVGRGTPLIERDRSIIHFKGSLLPQLLRSESILNLLEEPSIATVRSALLEALRFESPVNADVHIDHESLKWISQPASLDVFRRLFGGSAVLKAYVLQTQFPEQFAQIKSLFIDAFPFVEDVTVETLTDSDESVHLGFRIKETKVPNSIIGEAISSGMLRTLVTFIDLTLAPAGTCILIDEFENSLGVNCMPAVTDLVLSRAPDLQFIITSHHPYIINNIPKEHWKVVQRKGSVVRAIPASKIKALQTASAQENFLQLINTAEFEEGAS